VAGAPGRRTVDAVALQHVLWIGGPPGVGKTTIAGRLARRHGLRHHNVDTRTWAHRDRALREGSKAARRWEAMTPRERWVETPPEEMLELSLHFVRWPMIADDVRALPRAPLVVAEGPTVVPDLVAAGIADPARAVWLLPTPALQRARLAARHVGPAADADERRARENADALWLLVTAEIERRVAAQRVRVLREDGSRTVEESLAAVEAVFAEALADGPRAETPAERRALLRAANDELVEQVRAYLARPWATGDETITRRFACECDDRECGAVLELPVAEFPAGPLLAAGHAAAR
jgi:hypothetical protein